MSPKRLVVPWDFVELTHPAGVGLLSTLKARIEHNFSDFGAHPAGICFLATKNHGRRRWLTCRQKANASRVGTDGRRRWLTCRQKACTERARIEHNFSDFGAHPAGICFLATKNHGRWRWLTCRQKASPVSPKRLVLPWDFVELTHLLALAYCRQ